MLFLSVKQNWEGVLKCTKCRLACEPRRGVFAAASAFDQISFSGYGREPNLYLDDALAIPLGQSSIVSVADAIMLQNR